MNRQIVIGKLEAALSDVLERTVSGLDEGVRLADDLHLDSTSMLELLMALEEAFDTELDPEDLDIEDFTTVGTLTDFMLRTRASALVTR
jgi:acyl carrier protein